MYGLEKGSRGRGCGVEKLRIRAWWRYGDSTSTVKWRREEEGHVLGSLSPVHVRAGEAEGGRGRAPRMSSTM